jgi:DNA-binding CsgD family transcriptional regulator
LDRIAADAAGPVEELIALEDDADLTLLVEKVSSSLTDGQRDVLALYGSGLKRPQIADRLGVPEREVKEQLRLIVEKGRAVLANLAGGGCRRGEPMVMRFICGVSTSEESAKARKHLSRCGRCHAFSERLIAWREKAGAMLPAPVAEGADPGVLGRIAHVTGQRLTTMKQHLLDGASQVKQQAATTYYRAVDPTPLLGMPSVPDASAYPVVFPLTLRGGPLGLRTPLADGNISLFPDRWELIERNTLPAYRRLIETRAEAQALIGAPIAERVRGFRLRRYWPATVSAMLTRWSARAGSDRLSRPAQLPEDSSAGRPAVLRLDLSNRSALVAGDPGVRAWAKSRHQSFPIAVSLPGDKHYLGRAQLAKLYRPSPGFGATRLTVKLPATDQTATLQMLRQLAEDWHIDNNAVTAWIEDVGRPNALDHHYSTRVFTAENVEFVGIEIQVEHHVAENQFIVDMLFSVELAD